MCHLHLELDGGLRGAEGVEGEHDLGDDRVRVPIPGGRGGALPGLGDDGGALHEPHGAVRPRRLQVLGLLAHPDTAGGGGDFAISGIVRFGGEAALGLSDGERSGDGGRHEIGRAHV